MPRESSKRSREWRTKTERIKLVTSSVKASGFRSPNDFIEAFYTSTEGLQALRAQKGKSYSPETILDGWMEHVPSGHSRDRLHQAIMQRATEIVTQESSRACQAVTLHMTPATLDAPYLVGESFGFETLYNYYITTLPCLTLLLLNLLTAPSTYEVKQGVEKQGKHLLAKQIVLVIISMLLYNRNQGTNAFQMVMGVFMASSGASRRIIDNFNHMGLCVSYWTIQRALTHLSEDSRKRAQTFVKTSKSLWGIVYDNINFTLRKASQRVDSSTHQINATTLALFSFPSKFTRRKYDIALSIAECNKLIGKRRELNKNDLVPNAEANENLEKAFKHGIRNILLTYLPGQMRRRRHTKDLQKQANKLRPVLRCIGHEKTTFFPSPALNEEEASVLGTTRVVTKIYTTLLELACDLIDVQLRLLVGDWLTIRNLRLMKHERRHECSSFERFQWVQEASMPFHFQLNAMYALFRTHFGVAKQQNPSSLDHHRTILCRAKLDPRKPKYNKAKELAFHSLAAWLLDCTRIILGLNEHNEHKKWKPDWNEFEDVVEKLYSQFTTTAAAHKAINQEDEFLAHSILCMRDTLMFWEFCDAIRQADVGRMWVVYDFWLFVMRGAGCHNYGNELLEMKAQFQHEFPPLLREVVERTWLVNQWGKKGRSIPTDLYLEHNNGFTKNMFAAMGSCASIEHVQQKSSACVEVLRSLSHKISEWFKVRDFNRKHREVSIAADLAALCLDMEKSKLHSIREGRIIPLSHKPKKRTKSRKKESALIDALTKGMDALSYGKLYEKWLNRSLAGGNLEDVEGDIGDSDAEEEDIAPAFADRCGTMPVDTAMDEEFPECSYSNIDVNSTDANG